MTMAYDLNIVIETLREIQQEEFDSKDIDQKFQLALFLLQMAKYERQQHLEDL